MALGRKNYLFCGNLDAAENAAIIYTFMGCCKLAQVDVRKWLNHFFTHIHDYDEDYSCDLLELIPHNLKQKGTLTSFDNPPRILDLFQESWSVLQDFENISNILEGTLHCHRYFERALKHDKERAEYGMVVFRSISVHYSGAAVCGQKG